MLGFEHEAGTATFVDAGGVTFDLFGYGEAGRADEIASGGPLKVMVFSDLSLLLSRTDTAVALSGGGRALTPAAFCAAKLLAERSHKGAKDKIQALLVIAERKADVTFATQLEALVRAVERARRDDARASAQEALLALGTDPAFKDAGAEGYAQMLAQARAGLDCLRRILELIDG